MVDAARVKDARAFNRADMAWHLHVWRMSSNEYLEVALRRAVLPFFAFVAIRISSLDPLSLLRDAYGHLPLIEAIKARDAEKAKRAFASTLDAWLSITRAEFAENAELEERRNSPPAALAPDIQPASRQ